MEPELIKTEIKSILEKMGFGGDLESIEAHQGATARFSVRIRHVYGDFPPAEFQEPESGESTEAAEDGYQFSRSSKANMLIGERGNNLAALEHVLKKIIRKKHGGEFKFTLDINDYRLKRLEDLKQDVKNAAREVRLYKKEVPLRPMSSFERRIVHLLLAEYPDITTESIGQEPDRRVVIKPYP